MKRRSTKLRRRYGRAVAGLDYFEGVARTFLHPIVVRHHTGGGGVTEKDVRELTGVLERTAARAREGKL